MSDDEDFDSLELAEQLDSEELEFCYFYENSNFYRLTESGQKEKYGKNRRSLRNNIRIDFEREYDYHFSDRFVDEIIVELIRLGTDAAPKYIPLSKQKFVINRVKAVFGSYNPKEEVRGESGRRIDLVFDLGGYYVFLEIDENAHIDRNDELIRIEDIKKDYKDFPIVLILMYIRVNLLSKSITQQSLRMV
jgi:hypothetical protein